MLCNCTTGNRSFPVSVQFPWGLSQQPTGKFIVGGGKTHRKITEHTGKFIFSYRSWKPHREITEHIHTGKLIFLWWLWKNLQENNRTWENLFFPDGCEKSYREITELIGKMRKRTKYAHIMNQTKVPSLLKTDLIHWATWCLSRRWIRWNLCHWFGGCLGLYNFIDSDEVTDPKDLVAIENRVIEDEKYDKEAIQDEGALVLSLLNLHILFFY